MLLALFIALFAHPNSISSALITEHALTGREGPAPRFDVELRFEARTASELFPLDTDGDGRLSGDEVAAASETLGAYLAEHYHLRVGGESPELGRSLTPKLTALGIDWASSQGGAELLELNSTWLVAHLDYLDPAPAAGPDVLWVSSSLFLTTSPDHRNFARFQGPPAVDWVFSAADPLWLLDLAGTSLDEPAPSPLAPWMRLGFEHILDGPDHLCFVLGLLLAVAGLRQLAWTITGFTLAHSVTLGLAAFGLVPSGGLWVEVLIALSIVYVGAANLVAKEPRRAWPEAFVFGLVHGLGFAAVLGEALGNLAPEASRFRPLLGFNLGIELGQLAAAGAALVGLFLLESAGIPRKQLVKAASLGVCLAGLTWFGARVFA